ncbi:MAG: fatty acyl-AMP ligase, partial [Myxococcota bacterium]
MSLVDLLRRRVRTQGGRLAYRFLTTGEVSGPAVTWTYDDLDKRARNVAAALQQTVAQGQRVLLLYPPDSEFIAGFLGSVYAGAVAIPTYPPDPARLDRTLPRLRAIVADSQATAVLTSAPVMAMAQAILPQAPELAGLRWIVSDELDPGSSAQWQQPTLRGDDLAFLQYTSGSTGTPKGVMVSHANILHNERLIAHTFGHDQNSVGVGWLPMFHDMGLIGNVLQPLYSGFPCTLMSPLAFLSRPLRWLQAISAFRATTSGGPSFAYELCVRKIGPDKRAELDLSSWSVAFNGAEPIRAQTLDRFTETFAPQGFRRSAFLPCYGLAEATLLVSGADKHETPVVDDFERHSLAHDRAELAAASAHRASPGESPQGKDTTRLVASGRAVLDQRVVIVDPDTRVARPSGGIGEIWVAGPSVAQGYWNRPEATAQAFSARLSDSGDGPYLRTGDLGFVRDGQLFVTGRRKDLIIIRGRNHAPQDIELAIEQACPAVRPGCCAALSVDEAGAERLVIAAEYRAGIPAADHPSLAVAIGAAV